MSEENVEMVRRAHEGINARLEAPRGLFDPDFELDLTEVSPDGGVLRGFEVTRNTMREYWGMFEEFRTEIEEVIFADEEHVVIALRDGGRMKGSDADVWNRFFQVWTFGDGKFVRCSIHTDRKRALEAAGLKE